MKLTVRELQSEDAPKVVDYFWSATPDVLQAMGADKELLPERQLWIQSLASEINKDKPERDNFYLIWQVDGQDVGHSNINNLTYGLEAHMHLHLWFPENRKRGAGTELVKLSIRQYFELFELKRLWCEPYAENPAPARTLYQVGFDFIKKHKTTPGMICFPQMVNQFLLTRASWASKTISNNIN